MNLKNQVSLVIDLDCFIKNPLKYLESSKEGTIAVLKNNSLVMYVVKPHILKKLFSLIIQYKTENVSKHSLSIAQKTIEKNTFYNTNLTGKFSMHNQWKPDIDFIRQASTWGINLEHHVKQEELKAFIDYWQAEKKFFYHIQWQQKLARHLEQRRNSQKPIVHYRDINKTCFPDNTVPDGFRDK